MPLTQASPGAAYGWRCRFGLLQPTLVTDNNPFEFYLMAPDGVQLVLTSLGIEEPGDAAYVKALAGIETPIRRLLARNVDVIIQAGVPPIVNKGWGAEDELRARVAEWTGVPFASDIGCSIAAFQALGIRRLAVLGTADLRHGLVTYLANVGIEVIGSEQRGPAGESGDALALSTVYRSAVAYVRSMSGADGLFIPIASRPTVGAIADIEEAVGIPVVTSAQAMMYQGLRLAGCDPTEVVGCGKLFQVGTTADSPPVIGSPAGIGS